MSEPTHCQQCGEPLKGEASAELARHNPDAKDQIERKIVHAEPCAMEMLNDPHARWTQA